MITIYVNGQQTEIAPATLAAYVAVTQSEGACFATAVNGGFIAREDRENYQIQAGDQIEILTPMQGG